VVQTLQSWPKAVRRKLIFAGGCDWGANQPKDKTRPGNAGVLAHDDNGMRRLIKEDEYSKDAV